MTTQSVNTVFPAQNVPTFPAPDGQLAVPRSNTYGDQYMIDVLGGRTHALAHEGTYFLAQNPTIDAATTLVGHAAPVLADNYTKPFVQLINGDVVGSKKRTFIDWICLTVITPGASGTSDNWRAECDTGGSIARYSSGTIITLTTVNPNMQSANAPVTVATAGPYVALAPTTKQRVMGHGVFRPSIAITGDKYLFTFGQPPVVTGVVASAITQHIVGMPPVVLGPTDMFFLHLYAPSQSAAGVYKVEVGFWER